jgi:hydrogenase maturation protease
VNLSRVEKIANAVLYEGYILFPYRPSAIKNRQRWNFGVLSPQQYSKALGGSEPWTIQTECLVQGSEQVSTDVKIRFLHVVSREIAELVQPVSEDHGTQPQYRLVSELKAGERSFQPWQEALEREVNLPGLKLEDLCREKQILEFSFHSNRNEEPLRDPDGSQVGLIIRTQEEIEGVVEVSAERSDPLFRINVSIMNLTPLANAEERSRNEVLMRSMVSVHTIISANEGKFVSLIDPPEEFRSAAAKCSNVGTWPVLAGDDGDEDMMLSSPIILYDYPQVAAESAGDLCDGTETDELLTLCILALTDEEKREMLDVDDRARAILERTEMLPSEQLLKMHGAIRGLRRAENKQ